MITFRCVFSSSTYLDCFFVWFYRCRIILGIRRIVSSGRKGRPSKNWYVGKKSNLNTVLVYIIFQLKYKLFVLRWKTFTVVIALHWDYLAIWSRPASVKRHRPLPNRFKVCELSHETNFFESHFIFTIFQWPCLVLVFLSFFPFFTLDRSRSGAQFVIRHIERYRSNRLALCHDAWLEESINVIYL